MRHGIIHILECQHFVFDQIESSSLKFLEPKDKLMQDIYKLQNTWNDTKPSHISVPFIEKQINKLIQSRRNQIKEYIMSSTELGRLKNEFYNTILKLVTTNNEIHRVNYKSYDLHGLTTGYTGSAYKIFELIEIELCKTRTEHLVHVIHGRGLHSSKETNIEENAMTLYSLKCFEFLINKYSDIIMLDNC